MTIGHLRSIIQYLPDAMLIMTPMDATNDSHILPVCNKSRVEQILIGECEEAHIETVLLLVPCVCDLIIHEDQQDIAEDLIFSEDIDN